MPFIMLSIRLYKQVPRTKQDIGEEIMPNQHQKQ